MRLLSLCALLACADAAIAQRFEADVLPASSQASVVLDATLVTHGFLIGNHDPNTNPGGTQTRPGAFGGSGNQPIPAALAPSAVAADVLPPRGPFTLELDPAWTTAVWDGLQLDVSGETSLVASVTATLSFDTFHTVNPNAIYPGGFPITLPLGDSVAIRNLRLLQIATAAAALDEGDDPQERLFETLLPVELALVLDVLLPDAPPASFPIAGIPLLLPFSGSLRPGQDADLEVHMATEPFPVELAIPLGGAALPGIPLELPTLGPATASVVLHLEADQLLLEGDMALDLLAHARAPGASIYADGFEQAAVP
jgi:hypothetical protein